MALSEDDLIRDEHTGVHEVSDDSAKALVTYESKLLHYIAIITYSCIR